eukprot:CAMPEP_0197260252 /NCGR_PEP_ID=MMETSP1429-20130617/83936_1 /TAXON_ID=49237 /ORGANISM="Chaetoceros  sp., Strain UNC1202" /LENGTH=169 /DNA_ID=CAMNT_0042724487 /DNA_START=63 /DNA_END=575 /DNA_ORIENTATION=+
MNKNCLGQYGEDKKWMCLHGSILTQYIETPLFIANSKYDVWQERGILSLNPGDCPGSIDTNGNVHLCNNSTPRAQAEGKFWRDYGEEMVDALSEVPDRHGAFFTSCPLHCMTSRQLWNVSAGLGDKRFGEAFMQWFYDAIEEMERTGKDNMKWKAPRWIADKYDICLKN